MDQQQLPKEFLELAGKYKVVFNGPAGQDILEDLEKQFHVRHSTYKPEEALNPYALAVREGERTAVLYIRNMRDFVPQDLKEEGSDG